MLTSPFEVDAVPIVKLLSNNGTLTPSQVDLVGRVFNRLSDNIADQREREALAARVVALYLSGVTDEDALQAEAAAAINSRPS